jgi:4-aminobutyrate--pyruvate transaminase
VQWNLRPIAKQGEKFDPTQKIAAQAVAIIQKHGVILRALPGDIIGFCPPLIITAAEIGDMFNRIESGLDEVSALVAKLR